VLRRPAFGERQQIALDANMLPFLGQATQHELVCRLDRGPVARRVGCPLPST
jgi:hypothetical protein